MLQISRRADYAVRIMIELGLQGTDHPLPAREVSRRTGVSKPFVHKIVADLSKASLVRTYAGPAGGLALAQPAHQVNLLDILEAVEGPLCLNTCLIRPQECPRDLVCSAHGFWGRLQSLLVQELSQESLDKLVAEAKRLKEKPRTREQIPYLFPELIKPLDTGDGETRLEEAT